MKSFQKRPGSPNPGNDVFSIDVFSGE